MSIEWSLVLFTSIACMGACMFAGVCVNTFTRHVQKPVLILTVIAFCITAVGGLISITHLSHPERVLAALNHPTSGIFIEAVGTALVCLTAIIYFILVYRKVNRTALGIVSVIGIALALVFSFFCGHSYMMSSQATWDNLCLPLTYASTSAVAGFALWLFFSHVLRDKGHQSLPGGEGQEASGSEKPIVDRVCVWLLACFAVLACIFALIYGFMTGTATGTYAVVFWVCIIFCGVVVPLVCAILILADKGNYFALTLIAAIGAVIASLSFRIFMWIVGGTLMSLFGTSI
ncbi:MAG: hypothetical protein LUD25_01485 [Coriobacteriaceae bacterium]|nr:hypothetical protein [Coriobacteriaceae bacterium]